MCLSCLGFIDFGCGFFFFFFLVCFVLVYVLMLSSNLEKCPSLFLHMYFLKVTSLPSTVFSRNSGYMYNVRLFDNYIQIINIFSSFFVSFCFHLLCLVFSCFFFLQCPIFEMIYIFM